MNLHTNTSIFIFFSYNIDLYQIIVILGVVSERMTRTESVLDR